MGELAIIFTFIILAGLIVFGFVTATHRRAVAHDERRLELKARQAEAQNGTGDSAKVRKLEERVRVLERLATDRGVSLADEIEGLRDSAALLNEPDKRENVS